MSDKEYQEISIYLDDSGVFSLNSGHDYFIYAGYLFLDNHERIAARERFKTMSREIKSSLGMSMESELKAAGLDIKYKRSLYNCVKSFNSLSATVKLPNVNESIMANKLSIHRYKDYTLKRMIKSKLEKLIASGKIDVDKPVSLRVYIDQQHTSTNGYYKLSDSIREELIHGIRNFDYGVFYPPILFADFEINIKFCDSSLDYLVQASDILANRLWYGRNFNRPKLYTNIPYHNDILLPPTFQPKS